MSYGLFFSYILIFLWNVSDGKSMHQMQHKHIQITKQMEFMRKEECEEW